MCNVESKVASLQLTIARVMRGVAEQGFSEEITEFLILHTSDIRNISEWFFKSVGKRIPSAVFSTFSLFVFPYISFLRKFCLVGPALLFLPSLSVLLYPFAQFQHPSSYKQNAGLLIS